MPPSHSEHDHDHAHAGVGGASGHSHAPATFGRAFAIGISLNASYVVAQVAYGFAAHSVALLADAVHNLGDVLGLVIAWGAMQLARRAPTKTRTYGWGRSTILASLANAVVLLLGCGAIAFEAILRFGDPAPVQAGVVMWVAAIGIVINGGTALLFMRGRKDDLNIKAAFLHLASDAAVSAGVVVAAVLIGITGWLWIDPATSLLIAVVITLGTWGVLRDSANLALDMVPGGIDLVEVEHELLALPGVCEVHDLHVWALSTTETALTAHLIRVPPAVVAIEVPRAAQPMSESSELIMRAAAMLQSRFNIGHSTVQVETAESADACALRSRHTL